MPKHPPLFSTKSTTSCEGRRAQHEAPLPRAVQALPHAMPHHLRPPPAEPRWLPESWASPLRPRQKAFSLRPLACRRVTWPEFQPSIPPSKECHCVPSTEFAKWKECPPSMRPRKANDSRECRPSMRLRKPSDSRACRLSMRHSTHCAMPECLLSSRCSRHYAMPECPPSSHCSMHCAMPPECAAPGWHYATRCAPPRRL
jgi:hypothetical protein